MINFRRYTEYGDKIAKFKLEHEQVLEIWRRVKDGEGVRDIAREFNISHTLVSLIVNGKRWVNITGGSVYEE
jgi:hypothetical protein